MDPVTSSLLYLEQGSNNHSILASPVSLLLVSATGRHIKIAPPSSRLKISQLGSGAASWTSHWSAATDLSGAAAEELRGLSVVCVAELSSDGFVAYNLTVRSTRAIKLQNVPSEASEPSKSVNLTYIYSLCVNIGTRMVQPMYCVCE